MRSIKTTITAKDTFQVTKKTCPDNLKAFWDLDNPVYEAVGKQGLFEQWSLLQRLKLSYRHQLAGSFTLLNIKREIIYNA